jgi:hypothetical protein
MKKGMRPGSLISKYELFIWEVVKAHVATAPKCPETVHYRGEGVFTISGRSMGLRAKFKPENVDSAGDELSSFQLLAKLTQGILTNSLPDGVTVTQRPLEPLFMVRIHVGQPADYHLLTALDRSHWQVGQLEIPAPKPMSNGPAWFYPVENRFKGGGFKPVWSGSCRAAAGSTEAGGVLRANVL